MSEKVIQNGEIGALFLINNLTSSIKFKLNFIVISIKLNIKFIKYKINNIIIKF